MSMQATSVTKIVQETKVGPFVRQKPNDPKANSKLRVSRRQIDLVSPVLPAILTQLVVVEPRLLISPLLLAVQAACAPIERSYQEKISFGNAEVVNSKSVGSPV